MKARLTLALVAVVAVAAAFLFWLGGEERGTGGGQPALDDDVVATAGAAAALDEPRTAPVEERPAEREVLAVEKEEPPDPGVEEAGWVEYELSPSTFFGRVVDAETGAPLVGARTRLEDVPAVKAVSDANGVFGLDTPHEFGPIRVEHEGYAYQVVDAAKEHDTPERAFVVRLARSATLVARVERLDGPVAGLEVRVGTDGYWMKPRGMNFSFSTVADPTWRVELDAAGLGIVTGLPPHTPLTVDVHEGGRRLQRLPELQLEPGEERELVIRIGGGCRILGEAVESAGPPAEGLEVWLMAAGENLGPTASRYFDAYESDDVAGRAQVDAAGRFTFEDVAPGKWFVGPAPEDGDDPEAVAPVAQLVEVTADDLRKEVRLTVHRGLCIRGRVVGPDGKIVGYAYVMESHGRADCNSRDGNFTLGPLAPGEYEIRAMPGGTGGFARSGPVTARAGDEDVVIEVRLGASLSVVVRDPAGDLVAADVFLIPDDPQAAGFSLMSTSQSPDGSFGFEGLPAGIYHVKATDAFDNVGRLQNLVLGEATELVKEVVTLSPGVRVVVRIANPDDTRNLSWRVLQDGVNAGFLGQSTPVVVAPGPIAVELVEHGGEGKGTVVLESREAEAVAGEVLEVVFTVEERE